VLSKGTNRKKRNENGGGKDRWSTSYWGAKTTGEPGGIKKREKRIQLGISGERNWTSERSRKKLAKYLREVRYSRLRKNESIETGASVMCEQRKWRKYEITI